MSSRLLHRLQFKGALAEHAWARTWTDLRPVLAPVESFNKEKSLAKHSGRRIKVKRDTATEKIKQSVASNPFKGRSREAEAIQSPSPRAWKGTSISSRTFASPYSVPSTETTRPMTRLLTTRLRCLLTRVSSAAVMAILFCLLHF